MKRTAIALFIVVGFGIDAMANDADRAALLDQMQAQYSVCVAFYTFKLSCDEKGETGRRLNAVKRRSEALASAISMPAEEIALRLELALSANHSLVGGCEGLSTLESRYGAECDPCPPAESDRTLREIG
jgi:hypothetical protein